MLITSRISTEVFTFNPLTNYSFRMLYPIAANEEFEVIENGRVRSS